MIDKKIIGRRREIAELSRIYEGIREGNGAIFLLAGEAGVGKTVLAEESLSQSGLSVFKGRAIEEATPPYGPISTAIRDCLRQTGQEAVDCGPLSPYLGIMLPELATHVENAAEEVDSDTLIEALSSVFSNMAADTPAAIFLDDLQWADNATLELIPPLAERLRYSSILILGTYRSDEIPRGHRMRWLRNELRRRRQLNEIPIEPLDEEASTLLMQRVLDGDPSPALVRVIFEKTRGLPLFVEELTNALHAQRLLRPGNQGLELIPGKDFPIPESIRDAILIRLDGLSDEARNQLEVAAIAGMEFDLELVAQLSGEETGLDELMDRNLIIETESGIGAFRHALTREAVQSEILWSRRRKLNRDIATYLESVAASPERIAEHWLAANELVKARDALLSSAERSCHLHAYRDAAKAAQRALDIWPEGEEEEQRLSALEQFAHCAQVSGQLSEAVRALREVLESSRIREDHSRHGEAGRTLATIHGLQGAWEQSLAARKEAAEAFEQANLSGEAAGEWLAVAARYTGLYHLETAIEYCDRTIELANNVERWDIKARALALKGNVLSIQGNSEAGIETAHEGLSLALKHNLTDAAAEVYRRLGSTLEYASEFTASREVYFTAYNYCHNHGAELEAQLCLGCMSYVLFRTGDWKQCIEICKEVINDQNPADGSRSIALCVLGLLRSYRGETRQAKKHLQEALTLAQRYGSVVLELICSWGFAQVYEFDGEDESAESYYRQIMDFQEKSQDTHDTLPALCSATTFFANRKQERETSLCVKALSSVAAISANNEAMGALAYALGETALLNRNPDEASHQFLQAISHFEKLQIPVELIKAEFRAGVAFAAMGSTEDAVRHLRNGYRLARNLGIRPLASQIAEKLEALGKAAEERRNAEAPERVHRGGLTSRQVEIARLIAEGLTNKEIANKLFLSPRTVEMHVANMLNRLDCRSRSEAVRKAGEMGLLE